MKLSDVPNGVPFAVTHLVGEYRKLNVPMLSPLRNSTLIREVYERGDCLVECNGSLFIGNSDWSVSITELHKTYKASDPYKRLRLAHSYGAEIEAKVGNTWVPFKKNWGFIMPPNNYRIKHTMQSSPQPLVSWKQAVAANITRLSKTEWENAVNKKFIHNHDIWRSEVSAGHTLLSYEDWGSQ